MLGGTSGFTAATICYPLDTIRRRMQMAGHLYNGQIDAFRTIWQKVRRACAVYLSRTSNLRPAVEAVPASHGQEITQFVKQGCKVVKP